MMYATIRIPMHHAIATQILFPTGWLFKSARIASTIEVTGWFFAKIRTAVGIDSVGTNAELINGKNISGYENAIAPSMDFADNPAIAVLPPS